MNDILDSPIQETTEPVYLKKSIRVFNIYRGLFVLALIVTFVKPATVDDIPSAVRDLLDAAVGLPVLAIIIMAPLGLYYCYKSSKREEGLTKTRRKYRLYHFLFCMVVLLPIVLVVKDLMSLFA